MNLLPWILHTVNKDDIMHVTLSSEYFTHFNEYEQLWRWSHSDTVSYTVHILFTLKTALIFDVNKVDIKILCTVSHLDFETATVYVIIIFCFTPLPPVNRSKFFAATGTITYYAWPQHPYDVLQKVHSYVKLLKSIRLYYIITYCLATGYEY